MNAVPIPALDYDLILSSPWFWGLVAVCVLAVVVSTFVAIASWRMK
jgi:hypothetical protein